MSPAVGKPSEPSCVLEVRATPKARRTDVRLVDDVIRVRVAEAPEVGKATEAVRRALAAALGLRRPAVALESGATSRTKRYLVTGLTEADARSRLAN